MLYKRNVNYIIKSCSVFYNSLVDICMSSKLYLKYVTMHAISVDSSSLVGCKNQIFSTKRQFSKIFQIIRMGQKV